MRIAGVMSGTSLDGIDVAIVEVLGRRIRTIGFFSTPYSEATRAAILAVSDATTHTSAISRLNFQLAELYARAVLRAVRRFGPVDLIGCHGQTVYHEGRSNTLQLGEPAVLAERTGLPVVSNFRARDIAAGGQGAPLVPYVDYLLFRHPTRTRVALNIGGIANITVIPPAATPEDIVAFDTGPGNMVIDALAQQLFGKAFDRNGAFAAQGAVLAPVLAAALRNPYFRLQPPRTAGREQFGREYAAKFLAACRRHSNNSQDALATATALTAETIARSYKRFVRPKMKGGVDYIVSGGGARNHTLMAMLARRLEPLRCELAASEDFGLSAEAKEAAAFALLAWQTWHHRPGNLPAATGATRLAILGQVTYA